MQRTLDEDVDRVADDYAAEQGPGGRVKAAVQEKTTKVGKGRLLGKAVGGAASVITTAKNALPGPHQTVCPYPLRDPYNRP